MTKSWFFIHGGWGGAWQWTPLMEYLNKNNILSHAVTMPGMGNNSGSEVTLNDFILHSEKFLKSQNNTVNIAAFSFGGLTATALIDRIPDKINRIVYIDAFVPDPGQSFAQIAGEKITRQIKAYSDVMGENNMIPPFFETDSRYCSHPLMTLFTPVNYSPEKLDQFKPTYIECTAKDPKWTFTPLLQNTAGKIKKRNWEILEIPSDHMPMYTHTEKLCELIF
jgi:pimeloyl-ACP methyl ester carboxylesterase